MIRANFTPPGVILRRLELARRHALTIAPLIGTGESRRWPASPLTMLQEPKVVSIDAAPRSSIAGDGDVGRREYVDQIFAAANIGADERRFLLANRVTLLPQRSIAAEFDWEHRKSERIRKSSDRGVARLKLMRPGGSGIVVPRRAPTEHREEESSRPVRRQRLRSGQKVWSMILKGPVFLAIAVQERPKVIITKPRARARVLDRLAA